ncbi:sortase domain-bontaining protein [Pontibacillus salicampi]|uniref:Sortase domain-bontaining protein n=1 Tax=Pontibacillus salicampi TaxID=1449801 RepID=A0ABV6LQ01_9BACI
MRKLSFVVVFGVILIALAACGNQGSTSSDNQTETSREDTQASQTSNQEANTEEQAVQTSKSKVEFEKDNRKGITPTSIEIPAIGVKTSIEHVGTLENGQMDVPKNTDNTAWYEEGPKPGAPGNSVIAGHVDDLTSPAVFYKLDQLKEGDQIIIKGKSGEKVTFAVQESNVYPRKDAPIDKIFGYSYRSMLNLITCTGEFNPATTERAERLVVSAKLVQHK